MRKFSTLIITVLLVASSATAQVAWNVDKSHSNIGFKVKHMVISTVRGNFTDYDISFKSKNIDNFEGAAVEAVLRTASINTDNERRDNHLKSDDFLNAEMYPEIMFMSRSFTKMNDDTYKVTGDLTIRDVTKEVELEIVYNGSVQNRGSTLASFDVSGTINRFDFNVKWNRAIETGGLVVSEDIMFEFTLEMNEQPATSGGK
ncbi:YceI family protein [candidate division KSB1 bacterium]